MVKTKRKKLTTPEVQKGSPESVKEAWAAYETIEERVEKESKCCLIKEMQRILNKRHGTISILKDGVYDLGIPLYDKDNFDLGWPLGISLLTHNVIVIECEMEEEDLADTFVADVKFAELAACSQKELALLFSEITEEKYFFLREDDSVTVCERLGEDKLNQWFDRLEDGELIHMFNHDHTNMDEFRAVCKEKFKGYDLEHKLEFYHKNY